MKPHAFHISRRTFLKRCSLVAAATGLPLWFVERELSAADAPAKKRSANDRPGYALVGCGGMGRHDANLALEFGDIVAICDVDSAQLDQAEERFTIEGRKPARYKDVRRVLERDDVHAIINVTPDHWHSLINIAAARAGKDIYAEKPLTLTIDEGRRVIEAVREHKVVLQTGTQQRSNKRFRLACELVRNGRLGRLKEANVLLPAGLRAGPFPSVPPPESLDWDFWQGPTPAVDYVKERCHTNFRFWYEYSGGTMTDWGAHHNDIAYWAIGILAPTAVRSERRSEPIPGGYTTYADYKVSYTYANGIALNIESTRDDDIFGEPVKGSRPSNGIRFVGTDGWIWVNRRGISASDPDLLTTPLADDATRLQVSDDHMGNFFECVRTREDPICNVETGHLSANMCHLGAISLRTGHALTWDYEAEKFTGDHAAEANTYLAREMRAPYDYSFGA